jgi:hypothetical protein
MSESFIPDERKAAFATFIEGVNHLSSNARFQEILFEFDTRGEEAALFAMADPAGYLKLRGVEVPEDFRVSVKRREDIGTGGGGIIVCYCWEVCYLAWCWIICRCGLRSALARDVTGGCGCGT